MYSKWKTKKRLLLDIISLFELPESTKQDFYQVDVAFQPVNIAATTKRVATRTARPFQGTVHISLSICGDLPDDFNILFRSIVVFSDCKVDLHIVTDDTPNLKLQEFVNRFLLLITYNITYHKTSFNF